MSRQIRNRIDDWEHKLFVGRMREREAFEAILTQADPDTQVVFISGPGGVGKTTLLREFMYSARSAGIGSMFIDARNIEPSPLSFLAATAEIAGVEPSMLTDHLASIDERHILFIDTYELIRPLDSWLRRSFLPNLSSKVVIVVAGRDEPSLQWRSRPGLQRLLLHLPLRNFPPDVGRAFLDRYEVPSSQYDAVLRFTHGHPLALALAADVCAQQPDAEFSPEVAINIIQTLLDQLTNEASGPGQRDALEAASIVRSLTEPLLAEMLGENDVRETFDWLRGLSCIELDLAGVRPHDLARDALVADLRWRNPERFAAYHERARHAYYRQFYASSASDQQQVLLDLLFLHRDNPVVQPFFDWQATGATTADALRIDDVPQLIDLVERYEGRESARLAAYWFERRPEQVIVFREEEQLQGFMSLVSLHNVTAQDLSTDPATDRTLTYLEANAPLRPGEAATLFRFWMATDSYQDVSAIQSLIFLAAVRHYLTTPGLAFSFFPCADSVFWEPFFHYGDLHRLPEADFEIGGRRYGVWGHDWRTRPPMPWLQVLADREMSVERTQPEHPSPTVIVLSKPDFSDAVRDALRNLHRPDQLAVSPLLRSRIIIDQVGETADTAQRVSSLETLIVDAVNQLDADPRAARGYRALIQTYIEPAPTQEQAAELLDLPFSTYRRHLSEGIDNLTDLLWQQEIGEAIGMTPQ